MKSKTKFSALLLAMLPIIFASSCEEKPVIVFTSIEGNYSCSENSAHEGVRKYIVEIDNVISQENLYIIANFHNLGDNEFLYAEYRSDTLYINNQQISNLVVNGKGAINKELNRIEFSYITDDRLVQLDYYAVYVR